MVKKEKKGSKAAAAPAKQSPPDQLMDLVDAFLSDNAFTSAHQAFQKQRSKSGWKPSKKQAASPSLVAVFQSWQSTVKAPAAKEDDSSDSSSSSDSSDEEDVDMADAGAESDSSSPSSSSSSSSSSDSSSEDSESEDEKPAPKKVLKRKAPESDSDSSSSESSSDSDSDSSDSDSSEDEAPKAKKQKTKASSSSSSGSDSSSSSSSEESSSDESSDSDSSDSDSDSDGSTAAKVPLPESDSDSSSSESESESEDDKKVKKNKKADKTKEADSASNSSVTLDKTSPEVNSAADPPLPPDPVAFRAQNNRGKNANGKKVPNKPFSRIPDVVHIDPRFASNEYVPNDYSNRAHEDLIVTKGKGFTKEKNKKKRGSYRGGMIDITSKKGVKFDF
ncbi:hypothetical protein CGCVW01_v011555 [Colletotrichum viniferum]|nr:hypothetical protein CGCVW01_v011555 [Colletotrichum viniferum]